MDSLRIDNRYVVEVHSGGLKSDDNEEGRGNDMSETPEEEILTLREFSERESARQSGHDEDAGPPRKKRRKARAYGSSPISVTGVVDAVSPVPVKDGSPFALVELYQPPDDDWTNSNSDGGSGNDEQGSSGGDVYTAVAILKGEDALTIHPAIEPGRTVTLSGVVSRKWEAGKGFRDRAAAAAAGSDEEGSGLGLFRRLGRRVPDRVLFVSQAKSVKLDGGCSTVAEEDLIPLPPTVESLSSVRGAVEAVHYHFGESGSSHDEVVSHVTLRLHGDEVCGEIAQVSFAKHALCPNLALGMQVGAVLRLVNVHRVHTSFSDESDGYTCCYAACLRSTVSIERCASETCHSDQQQWFLPRTEHHFAMLPDRRIGEMLEESACRTAEQHSAEERFIAGLGRALGRNVPRGIVDRLLTAHRARDLGGPAGGESSRSTDRSRSARRDPYAEFFDHGHHAPHGDSCVECGTPSGDLAVFRPRQLSTAVDMPRVASLTELRDGCASDFVSRVTSLFAEGSEGGGGSSSGWTASVTYRGAELCLALDGSAMASSSTAASGRSAEGTDIYTFCKVDGDGSCVVGDGRCRMPLCVSENAKMSFLNARDSNEEWVRLDAVSVSCLCVGPSRLPSENGHGGSTKRFAKKPSHTFLSGCDVGSDGHSFVFRVHGLTFAASVHIVPKAALTASPPSQTEQTRDFGDSVPREPLSVQECLEQTPADGVLDNSGRIRGQLVRKRFQFRKRTSDAELEMTLCQATEPSTTTGLLDAAAPLQTIEVKTSVPLCEASGGRRALEAALAAIHGSGSGSGILSQQHMSMALAWFVLAECPKTAPLTTSGLDEPSLSPAHQLAVRVNLPLSCRSLSSHGYQRFSCHVSDLKASYVQGRETARSTRRKINCTRSLFIPGMLIDRHLWTTSPISIARQISECCEKSVEPAEGDNEVCQISPLPVIENETGVPSFTLAQIHWEICAVLREGCSSHLRPSLVRRIPRAKILGITFCRAHIECASCFRVLNTSCRVCPNGCSRSHATVKWEVSATIDDGTGQAKLYADRDAALLVLGNDLDSRTVERGAWLTNEGIIYQPSLPASTRLLQSIKEATLRVRRELTESRPSRRESKSSETRADTSSVKTSTKRNVFQMLPDDGKAEYLLQQHCRHWYQNHCDRKLDLFVRCKPLSEHATTVNRAEIQVAQAVSAHNSLEFGLSASATLPPLKLKLEDACLATENGQENRIVGWDLVKSLQR